MLLLGFAMVASAAPAPMQGKPVEDGRWAILVFGISGDPALQAGYLKELVDLRGILLNQLAFPRDHVIALFDDPKLKPDQIQYQSTRAELAKACKEIANRAGKDDLLFVFLQGHGDGEDKNYRFNMVGPDPTGVDLAAMFDAIPARRQVIVNATNCSGASLDALALKGRIVISATKSGTEKNLTHFGPYFIEALAQNAADVDKNGRVSMFEAFSFAARKVEDFYTKEGSLQSEHPMMNDNGEAKALTLDEMSDARAATTARVSYLDRGLFAIQSGMSAEMQELAKQAQALEKEIEALKSIKEDMVAADYDNKLEDLLLKLAEVQAKLRNK
jgi:hypothetical protein